jgi:hypothetical protein
VELSQREEEEHVGRARSVRAEVLAFIQSVADSPRESSYNVRDFTLDRAGSSETAQRLREEGMQTRLREGSFEAKYLVRKAGLGRRAHGDFAPRKAGTKRRR